jgi:multifunctional beta-oxidation protein
VVLEERPFSLYSDHFSLVKYRITLRYSLLYGSRGANVVVNDFNKEAAQKVVDEINAGAHWLPLPACVPDTPHILTTGNDVGGVGRAVVNSSSVTDGHAVIKTALDAFGGVTILINNAGILRDKGFGGIFTSRWHLIMYDN